MGGRFLKVGEQQGTPCLALPCLALPSLSLAIPHATTCEDALNHAGRIVISFSMGCLFCVSSQQGYYVCACKWHYYYHHPTLQLFHDGLPCGLNWISRRESRSYSVRLGTRRMRAISDFCSHSRVKSKNLPSSSILLRLAWCIVIINEHLHIQLKSDTRTYRIHGCVQ
jgi:hypothetical protein